MHNWEKRRHGSSTYVLISILPAQNCSLRPLCRIPFSFLDVPDGDPNAHGRVCLQEWPTQTLTPPLHASLSPLPAQLLVQHSHGPGGQINKDKSAKKKRVYYFSGQSVPQSTVEKSELMLLALWADGREKRRGGRRWWQLHWWQCPASGVFSAHCHSVCISVLLFIISYADTHFQAWHDTRGVFIGHMHLQKVLTLPPVVVMWLFYHHRIISTGKNFQDHRVQPLLEHHHMN